MNKPKILITMPVPQKVMDAFGNFAEVDLYAGDGAILSDELIKRISDKTALISMLSDKIDKEVIEAGKSLKVIGNFGVGYNNIDIEYAAKKNIAVLNTPDVLTETTADLAWVLMMSVARRVVEADKFTRKGEFKGWAPTLMTGSDVYGKKLGIVGMGRIGQAIAKRAVGFNMKVLYFKRHKLSENIERELNARFVDLEDLLRGSDFIILVAPLTDETYHMINKPRLKMIKRDAFLINVGRGPLVDEESLVNMLEKNEIAGAGFDVYENEPEFNYKLKKMNNVVLLPHIGSATVSTRNNMGMLLVNGIKDILDGRRPANLVNM